MEQFSISFTLGKASKPHGANPDHNNRKFFAPNVDYKRTRQNITYARQDVEDAYEKLFGAAVAEYNQKQKQKCRRIDNYYEHIHSGKREAAYYEIIVQFGDSKTAPCGSERGEIVKKLLDEYMHEFIKRNPNLYIFNAVMHLDEAAPHLHIDFIPFYTKPRQRGLRIGVSMKQALMEMGFSAGGKRANQLVAWENSERNAMEMLLLQHGYEREEKHTKHKHMDVEQFKAFCELQNEKQRIANIPDTLNWMDIKHLYDQVHELEVENASLKSEKQSPYVSFYYTDADKQSFVQTRMESEHIPFRETENGFEAKECYAAQIRQIEKQYRTPYTSLRDKLRDDVDCTLMQSGSFEEFLQKMQKRGYEIKQGKYLAMRPKDGENFIRLKSLGEYYSEYGVRNRLRSKQKFEQMIEEKRSTEPDKHSPKYIVLDMIRFYTVSFAKNDLPMRRKNPANHFSWTNDAELDKLLELNRRINEGATLDSLRADFAKQEQIVAKCEKDMHSSQHDLEAFLALKEQIGVVFEGRQSLKFNQEQARAALREFPQITHQNYQNIDKLVQSETEHLQQAQDALKTETNRLKEASDLVTTMERVLAGTYVQYLFKEEQQRRRSDFIPNGYFMAR